MKRKNPYQRLQDEMRSLWDKVEYPQSMLMWRYPKDQLRRQWILSDLAERTAAAEQLGYDVLLKNTDKGLEVLYRKKVPSRPFVLRY